MVTLLSWGQISCQKSRSGHTTVEIIIKFTHKRSTCDHIYDTCNYLFEYISAFWS